MINGERAVFFETRGRLERLPDVTIPEKSLQVAARNIARSLLVGEVRGSEAFDLLQAMNTEELRERLQARDDDVLDVIRKGEQLLFKEWADGVLVQFCYSWTYILGSADFSGPCANWNLV